MSQKNTPSFSVLHGDCLAEMMFMEDNSVDSIVCDPPYGLSNHKPEEVVECLRAWLAGEVYVPKGKGFMGKAWDAWVPGPEIWRECLRVLKPGGHVLAFAGTRSMDLMSMAIRLAGFELRDSVGYAHDGGGAPLLAWAYGSGFPKSLDVSKAIDKAAGVAFAAVPASGVGFMNADGAGGYNITKNQLMRIGASTEAAKQWEGWGTALKPAWEPVILARKPLSEGTVAANVLAWGTGAINVDGCRVAGEVPRTVQDQSSRAGEVYGADQRDQRVFEPHDSGRWPANLILQDSPEVVEGFPTSNGSGPARTLNRSAKPDQQGWGMNTTSADKADLRDAGTGSAARFFYCTKASKKDRGEGNHHATVKPTDLMRYLCRLVTPPGGTVFDPFTGSGSTGKAAVLEGFSFIGCELDAEYVAIARARIAHALSSKGV